MCSFSRKCFSSVNNDGICCVNRKVRPRDVRAHLSSVIYEWKSERMLHAVNSSIVLYATDFNVLYIYTQNAENQYNVL